MTTTIGVFEANNSAFGEIAAGPANLILNPVLRMTYLCVANSTTPAANTTDVFLFKAVAGENYVEMQLDADQYLYGKAVLESSTISYVKTDLEKLGAATYAEEVTPSDVTDLSRPSRAIWVGTGGNISLEIGGQTVIHYNVPNGSRLDVQATRVNANNTTANNIVSWA